jgi:hypothetical protein
MRIVPAAELTPDGASVLCENPARNLLQERSRFLRAKSRFVPMARNARICDTYSDRAHEALLGWVRFHLNMGIIKSNE